MNGLLLDTKHPILKAFTQTRQSFGLQDSPKTFLACVGPEQCTIFEDREPGVQAAVTSDAQVAKVPDLFAPSDGIKALGCIIAPSLLDGATRAGLL
jgi:beta-phosphoglucomutase-like phosphatase (HAD superfamily)